MKWLVVCLRPCVNLLDRCNTALFPRSPPLLVLQREQFAIADILARGDGEALKDLETKDPSHPRGED